MGLDSGSLIQWLALAASLEREGQYNNAKLLRAAADSFLRQAAFEVRLPSDRATLLSETSLAINALKTLQAPPALLDALVHSQAALAEDRLAAYADTPDPRVCRICGHLTFKDEGVCPTCGAQVATFHRIRPNYWFEAFDPFELLQVLSSTPQKVAALLDAAPQQDSDRLPKAGGWTLRQALSHLNDAQGVLAFRVGLILEQDNPALEAQAVFAWAGQQEERPAAMRELFEAYCASRAQTVDRLENLPLKDWWRRGQHAEFGELKLYQQVSYFACHELTHLPQIADLSRPTG